MILFILYFRMNKNIFFRCGMAVFLTIHAGVFAQKSLHHWSVVPRCSGEIREVKILKDGVRHGLWQCDKDGSLRFYYHDKINDGEDFQAAYTAPSGDTVRHISASSRAGFLVVRVVETPNMVKYYH